MSRRSWTLLCALLLTGAKADAADPFLRVLGIAQDGGLPHAACTCEHCDAARNDPARRHFVASLGLVIPTDSQNHVYLIDATVDVREQLDLLADVRNPKRGGVDRAPLTGIFLTHAHMGHYTGLMFLGFEAVHSSGLPVYATDRMADFLRDNQPWRQLVTLKNIALQELTPGVAVLLAEGIQVEPLLVPHRDELSDTVGYIVRGERNVLYVPDTNGWHLWTTPVEQVIDDADIDVALIDASFYSLEELPGRNLDNVPHPLVGQSMDRLQDNVDRGLEVVFIHLNHSNPALDPDSAARAEIESRGFQLGTEGMEIPLRQLR